VSRIVIWSPNFAPELTGIPPLVTDAAAYLARRHDVEVVTAMPNYPARRIHHSYRKQLWMTEAYGDVGVRRSWLRVRPRERFVDKLLYEASFTTLALRHALPALRAADVVLCTVPSLGAAVAAAALRHTGLGGTRLVLWVQDLVLHAALSLNPGRVSRRALEAARVMERVAFTAADAIVVCSPGFVSYVRRVAPAAAPPDLVYNWADLRRISSPAIRRDARTFLYTGNLGYTQGFETLIEAARIAGDEVAVEIVGDGNAAAHVRALAADVENVTVRPPVPEERYPDLLSSARAQIVVQRAVSADANFPSKVATYMASGRPILASLAPTSAAAAALRESGGGILVRPERPAELAATMLRLQRDPDLCAALGARGREYAEVKFDRERSLRALERVLLGTRAGSAGR
jgi:colanic acid biosynthesis glycosyl transferase WcaI